MTLSGTHYFNRLEAEFPLRIIAGMTFSESSLFDCSFPVALRKVGTPHIRPALHVPETHGQGLFPV